jgi:hypothetical protein
MHPSTDSSIQDPPGRSRRLRPHDRNRTPARVPLGLVLAVLTLATGLVATGQQPAAAAPGYRLGDIVRSEVFAAWDSKAAKEATALCPEGKVVVGGAAYLFEEHGYEDDHGYVTLTVMAPVRTLDGYGYKVAAAETGSGTRHRWSLKATAFCAHAPPGYRIVNAASGSSSSTVKTAAAVCDGQVALGSGAMVTTEDLQAHGVGLQVVRASGTGDITRAQATEPRGGYSGIWILNGYAVCADRPDGYEVRYSPSDRNHGRYRSAMAACTGDRTMLNAGAAVDAPADVTLHMVAPLNDLTRVNAYENTPTGSAWTLAAQVICAYD